MKHFAELNNSESSGKVLSLMQVTRVQISFKATRDFLAFEAWQITQFIIYENTFESESSLIVFERFASEP